MEDIKRKRKFTVGKEELSNPWHCQEEGGGTQKPKVQLFQQWKFWINIVETHLPSPDCCPVQGWCDSMLEWASKQLNEEVEENEEAKEDEYE